MDGDTVGGQVFFTTNFAALVDTGFQLQIACHAPMHPCITDQVSQLLLPSRLVLCQPLSYVPVSTFPHPPHQQTTTWFVSTALHVCWSDENAREAWAKSEFVLMQESRAICIVPAQSARCVDSAQHASRVTHTHTHIHTHTYHRHGIAFEQHSFQ
jgi:hypothetical protein